MIPIIHYFTLLILTEPDAYIDYRLIKAGKNVHNIAQYIIRAFAFILLSIIFAHHDNQYAWYSLICSLFVYWWLFDTSLNLMRGKKIWYVSNRGIDAIQADWPILFFFFKFVFFVAASSYFFNQSLFQL